MADGNKKKSRNYGHSYGVKAIEGIIDEAISQKIKYNFIHFFYRKLEKPKKK